MTVDKSSLPCCVPCLSSVNNSLCLLKTNEAECSEKAEMTMAELQQQKTIEARKALYAYIITPGLKEKKPSFDSSGFSAEGRGRGRGNLNFFFRGTPVWKGKG